ncbi:MAG TPA: transposase [Pyrinomonadaceae bacterium]|nr:transposase [Pyrinomonadaceae bacterium]
MAQKWSNINIPGALHFITGNVINRDPIFIQDCFCQEFFAVLRDLRKNWPAKVISYVLMPDHFHLIANPEDGNVREFAGALKAKIARKIIDLTGDRFLLATPSSDGATHQLWQESFKAVPLWSAWMIRQKINYIHANPVKAKLTESTKNYRWSSFRAFYFGEQEPLAVDQDWWWADDSMKLSKAMKELGWRSYHKRGSVD